MILLNALEVFDNVVDTINSWVWSPFLVILCLVAALYFSFGTRFVQIRRFRTMVRLLFSTDKKDKVGITSFQAFALALSGRVGTGNIVGVATAIGYGGPGAVVWMWIIAFLGAGSAFAEATLAQIYKENHNGQYRGGPAFYIEKGLRCKWLAILFAVVAAISCGIILPPVQSNGIAVAFSNTLNIHPAIVGAIVAVLIGLVIIGGIKRIADVAQIVAPFMAVVYVILAIVVLIFNISAVPDAFVSMIKSAFGVNQAIGGMLGSAIAWGVKRGIYSNEAGQGTGPIVAAAAKVSHPVKQGMVQAFSVYVDTLLVCTATAIMILACKTFNVYSPSGDIIVKASNVELGYPDVSYTIAALATLIGARWSGIIVSISLFFFAFTTVMAYYYYGETNVVYLLGKSKRENIIINVMRMLTVFAVFYGSLRDAQTIWTLGDIGVGMMAWINVIAILLLSKNAFKALNDYEKDEKKGQEPTFNSDELGIKNADFWNSDSKSANC